jgi:hypothetical protein
MQSEASPELGCTQTEKQDRDDQHERNDDGIEHERCLIAEESVL